jgi:NitT/TauT family transport system permease protein
MSSEILAAARPEHHRQAVDAGAFGVVQKPLSGWERLVNHAGVRKLALLVLLALLWEGYARWLNNPLLFPTFTATLEAFAGAVASGVLPGRVATSLRCW